MIRLAAALGLLGTTTLADAGQRTSDGPTGLLIDRGQAQRRTPPPLDALPVIRDTTATVESGSNVDAIAITGVRFDGIAVPASIAAAARPFVGSIATTAVLGSLAAALSDAYRRSAIALYTIAVPAQSFRDGIVHVRVAEGFIEHVAIRGDVTGGAVPQVRRYATMLATERPLRRATLERYLSFIRDIPGLAIDAQLVRGAKPGGVILVLTLAQKRSDLSLSFDNRTQDQLASGQVQATAKLYGALRSGDETSLSLATAADFTSYAYAGLAHSTPIGHRGLRATASIAHLATRTRRTNVGGNADVASLGISAALIRSYRRNLTLSGSIDGVDSDNAVLGSLVARERTRAARATASYGDAADRRTISASLTLARGLDVLSAGTASTFADTTFTKIGARVGLDRAIGTRLVARLAGAGQWTDDALPAVERFVVGGADFGRGFPVATLASDRGLAGSAELAWRPGVPGAFTASEVYVFGDGANVRYLRRGVVPAAGYTLASAGLGVRIAFKDRARLDLEAARPIDLPYPGFGNAWQFNLAWRLSLRRK